MTPAVERHVWGRFRRHCEARKSSDLWRASAPYVVAKRGTLRMRRSAVISVRIERYRWRLPETA